MRRWIGAALIAAAAAVSSSGSTPWIAAFGGAFVPPDIAQDVAAARLFVQRINPYGPAIREMHAQVVPVPVNQTFPYFPHPPFSLVVSWPLAYLSFEAAALAWFGFSMGLVFLLAVLLGDCWTRMIATRGRTPEVTLVLLLFAMLLVWPPVLYNLEKGQWSILLAVLVTIGWRGLSRAAERQGGAWLGLAAAVKVFPVLLGGYLLLRSRRGLVPMMLTGIAATAIPLLFIGLSSFRAFIGQSQLNMPYWETFPSVTFSLHGAVARLLIGGPWARPAIHAPGLAYAVDIVVASGLLACAAMAAVRSRSEGAAGVRTSAAFAAWVVLLPVLNPQSLGHNGVLLALPLVVTAAALQSDERPWLRFTWAVALVLISIPRQTLQRFSSVPLAPVEGLAVIALPMWGALALFAVTMALSAGLASRNGAKTTAATLVKY